MRDRDAGVDDPSVASNARRGSRRDRSRARRIRCSDALGRDRRGRQPGAHRRSHERNLRGGRARCQPAGDLRRRQPRDCCRHRRSEFVGAPHRGRLAALAHLYGLFGAALVGMSSSCSDHRRDSQRHGGTQAAHCVGCAAGGVGARHRRGGVDWRWAHRSPRARARETR